MRLAIDARYLNAAPSGIGRYTENLIRELLAADAELRLLLVTRTPGLAERIDPDRCQDLVFGAPTRSFRTVYRLAATLKRHEVDLFHGPGNLLPRGLPCPGVVTLHDVIPLQSLDLVSTSWWFKIGAGAFWRRYMTQALRDANLVLTVSETSKDLILERFDHLDASQVVVTPNGVDPGFLGPADTEDAARVEQTIGTTAPYVLLVGQLSPRKNHYRALLAFLKAFPAGSPMRLVLVTHLRKPEPRLAHLLNSEAARGRVIHLESVDFAVLKALYRQARIFFFPSYVEGFGLPLLEAMACGTPTLTSDRSAPREVAGDAALTCTPFSVDAMAEGLKRLDGDEALRTELVARGRARVGTYTIARTAALTLEAYRGLLEGGRT